MAAFRQSAPYRYGLRDGTSLASLMECQALKEKVVDSGLRIGVI